MSQLQTHSTSFKTIKLSPQITIPNIPNTHKLRQYHQLLRMKKLLADTQQKMQNRINLFKKASQKILKKRENEFKIVTKIQRIKSNQLLIEKSRDQVKSRTQAKTSQGKRQREDKKQNLENEGKMVGQMIIQGRIQNAKLIKEQKERFKIIIEQRKKLDFQRKLQSANSIRQRRQNVKIVKERYQNERKEEFLKLINDKYEQQRFEFIQMEKYLNELQQEEERALITWKNTMQCTRSKQNTSPTIER